MKRKLLFAGALCLIALAVWAANPSFSDFLTSQFATTSGNKVAIKSGAVLTNTSTYLPTSGSVDWLYDNGNVAFRVTKSAPGSAVSLGTRTGSLLLSYNPSSVHSLDALALNRAGLGGLIFNDNGTGIYDQSNGLALLISQQADTSELLSTFGNQSVGGFLWQIDLSLSPGSNNITAPTFFRNALRYQTNAFPLAAGTTWDWAQPDQLIITNADFNITAIKGMDLSGRSEAQLEVSNSAAAQIVCHLTFSLNKFGPLSTNDIYIGAGKEAEINGEIRKGRTNIVTIVEP